MSDELRWCPGVKKLGIENHWTEDSNFYRRMNNGKKRIDNLCKPCRIACTKEWRRKNKDKVSEYNKIWRERNLESVRTRQREYYRMALGKGAWTWKKYRVSEDEVRLPCQPFVEWVDRTIVPLLATRQEINEANGMGNGQVMGLVTWSNIARLIDMDERSINNYTSGKVKTVPRELMDRIGLLFGHMALSDELYEESASEAA